MTDKIDNVESGRITDGGKKQDLTMRPKDYARRINLGTNKMYQLLRIEGFPCLKIGRYKLVMVGAADKWLEQRAALGLPL